MTLAQLIEALQALTTAVQNLTNVAQPVATAFQSLQNAGSAGTDFTVPVNTAAAATQAVSAAVALLTPLVGVPVAGSVPNPATPAAALGQTPGGVVRA